MDPASTRPGTVIDERYALRALLGSGGSAVVHAADDLRLGRRVAIKTLRTELASDPEVVTAFLREARVAAALNHPGIVAVHDVHEGTRADAHAPPWMVLEFVDGQTLRDILKAERQVPPARAVGILADVLEALEHSHARGVVHRDVSPGNVMVAANGQIKVTDFGIAAAVGRFAKREGRRDPQSVGDVVRGTAAYLSPEQARASAVDARSDVYSAGCLLFTMLTGRPPFTADTVAELARMHVREQPPTPSSVRPDLPARLDPIVLRALAKDPADRFPDAASMRAALLEVRGDLVGADPDAPTAAMIFRRPAAPLPGGQEHDTGEVGDQPPEPDRRSEAIRGAVVAGLMIAASALLSRVLWWTTEAGAGDPAAVEPTRVVVPTLTGMDVDAAHDLLVDNQLQPGVVRSEVNSTIPEGRIIRTNPAAGAQVSERQRVDLVVSTGKAATWVPELVGRTLADARAALTSRGLRVGTLTKRDSAHSPDVVLESIPAQSTAVTPGSSVAIVVASGWSVVPDVKGLDVGAAREALTSAGFAAGGTRVGEPNEVPAGAVPGSVLRTYPVAGSRAPVGEQIGLVVSGATPEPSPSPTSRPSPEPQPTSPRPSPTSPTPSPTKTQTPSPTPTPTTSPSPSATPRSA
jgi:eukaryotic-like serine/threonine-protein kinase